uniref:Rne/Rng family ribonuclease n=1 Tax=Desertibaculum subflavum TaxID=2268458 RepID=UPI000E660339
MTVEILVEESPLETRIARVEDGRLAALDILRDDSRSLIDTIWLGRVRRVVPGMEAAFVEIGEAKAGFLAAAEIPSSSPDAGIASRVREGQAIVVQAIRDPVGDKGVRLTAAIKLSGRALVYTPREAGIRISRRVEDEAERARLAELVAPEAADGGFILRTAAAALPSDAILAEARALAARYRSIAAALSGATPPRRLAPPPSLVLQRILEAGGNPAAIVVEGRHAYAELHAALLAVAPDLLARLRQHGEREPLFEMRGIEGAIELALSRRVPLPSGGAIVIEPTEALTAIDVDAGGVGAAGDAETARLRVDLEAAAEAARQIRLRDIGGVIVIDFIRLREDESRARLMRALREAFAGDSAGPRIADLSPFGLVEMTRRRQGVALDQRQMESCATCAGEGRLPSAATVAAEAGRHLARAIARAPAGRWSIAAAPDV